MDGTCYQYTGVGALIVYTSSLPVHWGGSNPHSNDYKCSKEKQRYALRCIIGK